MEKIISFSSPVKDPFIYPDEIKLPEKLNKFLENGFIVKNINQETVLKKRKTKYSSWKVHEIEYEYFTVITLILEKKDDGIQ